MKLSKKLKFILPVLTVSPIVSIACAITSCGNKQEDIGPTATKVTITNVANQQEFDVQKTTKIELQAKVEPAEANQEVTYEILAQEGTGNIACSQTGIIYPNKSSGTITIRAWSKGRKICSDPIELVFWDSGTVEFLTYLEEETGQPDYAYAICTGQDYQNVKDVVIPTSCTVTVDGKERTVPVIGTSYGGFSGCSSLRYVRFPKQAPKFGYISSYSFYQCSKLTKIELPDSVVSINVGAFQSCTSLETVEFGKNLLSILNSGFKNCVSLINIDLPASLAYVGPSAFADCAYINNIYIGPNVATIGEGAFTNCWNSTIEVDKDNKYFDSTEDALFDKEHKRLLCCQHSSKATEYTIEDSVETIDSYAFCFCDNLKKLIFNDTSKCRSIGENAFSLCFNLNYVSFKCPQLKRINTALFAYCWNLVEMHIPVGIQQIERDAFFGCDLLVRVYFDNPTGWKVYNDTFEKTLDIDAEVYSGTDTEGLFRNAYKLNAYGSFISKAGQEPEWSGGYCNCIWTRNN